MRIYRKMYWPNTDSPLSLNEKAIYLIFVREWEIQKEKPFTILQSEIAEGLGLSKSTVKRTIKRLVESGVLSAERVSSVGHSSNLYSVEMDLTKAYPASYEEPQDYGY